MPVEIDPEELLQVFNTAAGEWLTSGDIATIVANNHGEETTKGFNMLVGKSLSKLASSGLLQKQLNDRGSGEYRLSTDEQDLIQGLERRGSDRGRERDAPRPTPRETAPKPTPKVAASSGITVDILVPKRIRNVTGIIVKRAKHALAAQLITENSREVTIALMFDRPENEDNFLYSEQGVEYIQIISNSETFRYPDVGDKDTIPEDAWVVIY